MNIVARGFGHMAVPLGGIFLGRAFASAYGEMQELQCLPPVQQRARVEPRLLGLLHHACENVPFYSEWRRKSGLEPHAIKNIEHLRFLPVITKSMIRRRGLTAFRASNLPPYRGAVRFSSGSTGEPFEFLLDRQALSVIYASHLFWDSWIGLRPFDRYLRLEGVNLDRPPGEDTAGARWTPPSPDGPALFRIKQKLVRASKLLYENLTVRYLCVRQLDDETASSLLQLIESFRPEFLLGYSSVLAVLGEKVREAGWLPNAHLRGIIAMAEPVTTERRNLITRAFRVPLTVRYGLKECGGWFAQTCSKSPDTYHVNPATVIVEILGENGEPVAPGLTGRVVVTDLWNEVMPLIRYDTGDLAIAVNGDCTCGRRSPRIGTLEGRTHECIRTSSGRTISSVLLAEYLWAGCPSFRYRDHLLGIREYQIIQQHEHSFKFLLVPTAAWDETRSEHLRSDLKTLLGEESRIAFEVVTNIPQERSGKRPLIKLNRTAEYQARDLQA